MSVLRRNPALSVLVALLAAAVVLFGVELATGAAEPVPPELANPCKPRDGRTGGIDATIQRIVLDGLDGAACRLHTTREELVLSLGGNSPGPAPPGDEHTIEVALRAGMLRAVDEADRRGDLPGFVTPFLRRFVESAPLDKLIRGGISLSDLLG